MKRSDLYSGPISWMARNPVAANLLMLGLLVGGLVMSTRIRQEVFPTIELDMVTISVPYPGASPAEVEQGIVLAIEEAVRPLDGIKEVTGTAMEGLGVVAVELEIGTDRNKALADVKNHVDRITTFPVEAERPIVSMPAWKAEAIWVVIHGEVEPGVLHEIGEQARDRLLADGGITYIELGGVRPLEIAVELPQENLRRYGLTLPQVAERIRRTALEQPAGAVKTAGGDVLLRTSERRNVGLDFADITVATSRDGTALALGDIAEISDGYSELDYETFFDGEPCVMLKVYSVGDESPTEVADAAKRIVAELEKTLPPGLGVATWRDRSEMYQQRVDLLLRNAAIGLVVVLVILGLFLEPRLAFWVTMGIPISFLGAFLVLPALDISLNMISLFAFIVTLGMVVDDAIVVGENIFRLRQEGKGFFEASIAGARRMAMPVTFSIATTVAAFSPLAFVPGVRGKIYFAIPVVAISVLVISLVESFFILPNHLAHVGRPGRVMGAVIHFQQHFSRGLVRFIDGLYTPAVRAAIRHRGITCAVAVALFMSSCGLLQGGIVKSTDFPKEESDWIFADFGLQFGAAPDETRAVIRRAIQAAREVIAEHGGEGISRGIFSELGQAETNRGNEEGSHLGSVGVLLVPIEQRDIGAHAFADEWRKRIGEVANLEFMKFDSSTGHGDTPPIDVQLSHRDPETLELAARELAARIATFSGTKDVDVGIEVGKPQLDFTLSEAGRRAGFTTADIAAQVRSAFYGAEALRQQRGRNELKVMVRLPRAERESLERVENLMLRTPSGGEMPLLAAAEVHRGRAYTRINRVDGKRIQRVQADVFEGEANPQDIMTSLYETVFPDLQARHPGLIWSQAGRQKAMKEFYDFLFVAIGFALLAIYGLIAVPLRSFVQPLAVVMIAIPFGFVGAILGHWLLGISWSMISSMGMVALSGVVVNDSLVYVDAANELRGQGMDRSTAAVEAGRLRFRPIMMTSLTTFGGLAPMIFETSVQARVLVPMAVSLGFGVMFSTLVILLLVPALFVM
ncbi:MAG TPA: efflux RND transporter permease subunit, partial [Polyangia bacterium]|nr:efflux RND transporter permease subunit [Polyangia bacterium]